MAPRVQQARRRSEERAFEHEERPRRVEGSSATVLALQRSAGNQAVMRLLSRGRGGRLQREPIADWGTEPVFRKHKSPPFILNLTEAVKTLRTTPPGLREQRKSAAETVYLLAKYGFRPARAEEPKLDRYETLVRALADAAEQEVARLKQLIADYALASQREQQSRQLPQDIAQYAQHDPSLQTPDVTPYLPSRWGVGGPSYAHALSVPRGPGGELTGPALTEMNQMAQSELATDIATTRGINIDSAGKTPDELRELMDRQRNPLSGKTAVPELANLAEQSDAAREKTRTVQLGGVAVTVTYDKNDETVSDRASMLATALQKIAAAGVQVPAFAAYFPRYGRGLAIKDDCVAEQGERKPAVFKAPDTLFLPAHIVANPKLEQGSATGPFFLSTALDASGVATTVHEIGHMLHYRHNPSGFHLLQETFHAGPLQDIKQIDVEVSAYAGKNPREFVAEVFLGLVYGRRFSPAVMQRYAGLRGHPVVVGPVVAAPPPAFGTGRTIAYPSKLAKEIGEAKLANAPAHVLGRLGMRWRATRDRDLERYAELKALLGPPPPGAVIDDARLRIELPYNYQVVREQHLEFGLKLQEFAKDFFTPEEKQLPGGDGVYSAKDLAGRAFNDPTWARRNERKARHLLKDARTEFANFDYDEYDQLFGDSTPQELAAEFATYPERERVGALMKASGTASLIVAESHGDPRSKGLVVDNIEGLIAAGVDTLYVEHFRRNDYQSLLDIYNQTRGTATPLPAPLARLIENLDKVHNPGVVWPRNLKGVVEIAHRRGLSVMGMDASGALTKTGEGMERRAARMNFVAAEAIKADVNRGLVQKFVMLVGEAHVHTHERGGEPGTVPGLAELLGANAVRPGAQGPELLIDKESNR